MGMPVSDERAFELACRLKDHLTAEEAAVAIMEYATDAIEQERADRTWISPIRTVADLANNLLTLDQALDVYGAYFIDQTEDRCRVRGLSLSLEHVANDRIKRDASIPPSLVIWSSLDQRLQGALADAQGAMRPVAWRYQRAEGWGDTWRVVTTYPEFEAPGDWVVEPLYAKPPSLTEGEPVSAEPCCPFCGRDPFHRVDNGIGMEAVGVTCCDLGDAYFRGARPPLEEVTLGWDEFVQIGQRLTAAAVPPEESAIEFPYTRTFQAIAAATSLYAGGIGINVSVQKFQDAFNNYTGAPAARSGRPNERQTPAARWREAGEPDPHGVRYDCERAQLAGGDLTDDEVANAVFLDPGINNLTIAKDRIRWLSRRLAERGAPCP